MKPLPNHIIVGVHVDQKQTHVIHGKDGPVLLYIARHMSDHRGESTPTVARVHYVGAGVDDVSAGDMVIVNYMAFVQLLDHSLELANDLKTNVGDERLFAIKRRDVLMKFDAGGTARPMKDYAIVEPYIEPYKGELVVKTEPAKNKYRVLEGGTGFPISDGGIIYTDNYADETLYYSIDNRERSVMIVPGELVIAYEGGRDQRKVS